MNTEMKIEQTARSTEDAVDANNVKKEVIIYKLNDEDQELVKYIQEYFKNTSGFELNNDQVMKHIFKQVRNQFQLMDGGFQYMQPQPSRWTSPTIPQTDNSNFSFASGYVKK